VEGFKSYGRDSSLAFSFFGSGRGWRAARIGLCEGPRAQAQARVQLQLLAALDF